MISIEKSVAEDVVNRATYTDVGEVACARGSRISFQSDLSDEERDIPLMMKKCASHLKWHLGLALVANSYLAVFWSDIAFSGFYAVIGNMLLMCFLLVNLTSFSQVERGIDYEEERAGIQGLRMCSRSGLRRVMRAGR